MCSNTLFRFTLRLGTILLRVGSSKCLLSPDGDKYFLMSGDEGSDLVRCLGDMSTFLSFVDLKNLSRLGDFTGELFSELRVNFRLGILQTLRGETKVRPLLENIDRNGFTTGRSDSSEQRALFENIAKTLTNERAG